MTPRDHDASRDSRPPVRSGPQPKIIRGRPGYRSFSLAALQERVEAQLEEELAGRSDILLDALDETARRELVREAGEYVLAVEAVSLGAAEKAGLFDAVYRRLFTFGPLDALLTDDLITDLTIDGYERVYLRRRYGKPEAVRSPFEDAYSYARVLDRMLTGAGAQLVDAEPFIEVGLTLLGRPARLTLVAPPLSPVLHVDLRLHPARPATLENLMAEKAVTQTDADMLRALGRSPYGILIVGEAAAGKTTLLESLLPYVADRSSCWLVERAREVRAPLEMHSLAAIPARQDHPGVEFAAQIEAALAESPGTLILDELRGDEAGPFWKALSGQDAPRCLGVFRSSPNPERLHSAFGILIRKGQAAVDQALIDRALLDRMPFVIAVQGGAAGLHVKAISEWTEGEDGRLALLPLVQDGQATGHRSGREPVFP